MQKIILLSLVAFLISCSSANKKEAIEAPMPESQQVDGKNLVLIGTGFRIASRMGFTAKVYKAGLYAEKKGVTGADLFNSVSPKKLYMRFTYTVNKAPLVEAWNKAYTQSCVKNCSLENEAYKKFLEVLTPMAIGEIVELVFRQKGIEITINKTTPIKATIDSIDLSYDLLSVFVGEKVLDPNFKAELLGQK